MSGDLVRRLRAGAPFGEDEGVMLEAADVLEVLVGSGTPAFVSLVGEAGGVLEVSPRTRAALIGAGWVPPEAVEGLRDAEWQAGFNMAAKGDAA